MILDLKYDQISYKLTIFYRIIIITYIPILFMHHSAKRNIYR